LNPQGFTIFSTAGVNVVQNFQIHVFWVLVLCLWPGQSDFMVFNLWIGPSFIF